MIYRDLEFKEKVGCYFKIVFVFGSRKHYTAMKKQFRELYNDVLVSSGIQIVISNGIDFDVKKNEISWYICPSNQAPLNSFAFYNDILSVKQEVEMAILKILSDSDLI